MVRPKKKASRLELRIASEEVVMLEDLAAARGVSSSEVVRTLIRDTYRSQFAMKNPGAEIRATPRAILEAVTRVSGLQHLTIKRIAALADVAPSAVESIFRKLERKKFFESVAGGHGGDATWESWAPLEELLREAEKKGVRLDTPIEQNALSLEVCVHDRAKGVIGIGPIGASAVRRMPELVDQIRGVCRKVGAQHQGQSVSTREIASQLGAALALKLGCAVDAYCSTDHVQFTAFHIEA